MPTHIDIDISAPLILGFVLIAERLFGDFVFSGNVIKIYKVKKTSVCIGTRGRNETSLNTVVHENV